MDIGSIGAYQLDQSRFEVPDVFTKKVSDTEAGGDFADLLADAPAKTAGRPVTIDKTDKLYEQCEALETFLLKTLVTGMRKTIDKSDINKGGFAGEMYEDMLYDEYAKDFAHNANFGLAELAYLELTGQRGKPPRNAD
jgi:flagellar protein FlgJ